MTTTAHDHGEGASRHPRLGHAVKVTVGTVPILLAAGLLLRAPAPTGPDLARAAVLGCVYVIAFRTEFTSSRGSSVPTEPVLVAMLLTLPTAWVPAVVVTAVLVGSYDLRNRDLAWWQTLLLVTSSAWGCVAPVAVFLAYGGRPDPGTAALVTGAAVAAQLGCDALPPLLIAALERETQAVLTPVAWMLAVDAILAVVGYCIVAATGGTLPAVALVAAPILLVRLLARDRAQYYHQAQDLRSAYSEVTQEARRDPMTGLLNRRGWEETLLATEARLAQDDGGLVATVLVADLDRLKLVNDTHGHLAGDSLICAFAEVLRRSAPPEAAVARLGGDEFAVVITAEAATPPAPDLLAIVRDELAHSRSVGPLTLSASLGQATYPPAATLQSAVHAADHAARVDKEMRRMTRDHPTIRSATG